MAVRSAEKEKNNMVDGVIDRVIDKAIDRTITPYPSIHDQYKLGLVVDSSEEKSLPVAVFNDSAKQIVFLEFLPLPENSAALQKALGELCQKWGAIELFALYPDIRLIPGQDVFHGDPTVHRIAFEKNQDANQVLIPMLFKALSDGALTIANNHRITEVLRNSGVSYMSYGSMKGGKHEQLSLLAISIAYYGSLWRELKGGK